MSNFADQSRSPEANAAPGIAALPAVIGSPRHIVAGRPAASSFVSQLIAERQHLPPQRARRRATAAVAVIAYAATETQATPRLPPGFRKSLTA